MVRWFFRSLIESLKWRPVTIALAFAIGTSAIIAFVVRREERAPTGKTFSEATASSASPRHATEPMPSEEHALTGQTNPCARFPHHYRPDLDLFDPLCLNAEPLAAPLVLPDGRIRVALRLGDLPQALVAKLRMANPGKRIPDPETADLDVFALVDVTEDGEQFVAADTCPRSGSLAALAVDRAGRMHAVCKQIPLSRYGEGVAHGLYDEARRQFRWESPLRWIPMGSNSPVLLAMVGHEPVIISESHVRILRPSSKDHLVSPVDGAFAATRELLIVGRDLEPETPRYLLTRLNLRDETTQKVLDLPTVHEKPAFREENHRDYDPFGPRIGSTLDKNQVRLLLGVPVAVWEDPPEDRAVLFSMTNVLPAGGPRVLGSDAHLYETENGLVLGCRPGRKGLLLTELDVRYATTTCAESTCVVVYSQPFQPIRADYFATASLHVRRIDRALCTDMGR